MESVLVIAFYLLFFGGLGGLWYSRIARDKKRRLEKREETQEWLHENDRRESCMRVLDDLYENQPQIFEQFVGAREALQLVEDGWTAEDILEWINEQVETDDALVLGHHPLGDGASLNVSLSKDSRERHMYIVGKTGSGKTNFLRTLIAQDIERGDGVGIIAPEQEMLTEEILPYIPEHRVDDVIYFNPADTECPVSFNPLHLEEGEDIDLRADEMFTIFQRIMGKGGPRMDQILRQAIYALLERPGTTFLDVPRLLDPHDSSFRETVARESRDPETARFFRETYEQLPDEAHVPIINRLGRFIRPRTVRNVLCQPVNTLNFREAMDTGKILLFNFSDGILGETNASILGQLVVSKFQLATASRADMPKDQRRNFWLYMDEFQTFVDVATDSYEKMLSRARKYKLGLILAHQTTSQIPLSLLREVLGNVACIVGFVVSHDDANRLSKEFLIRRQGETTHVGPDELVSLRTGESFCKIGNATTHMRTWLADQQPDHARAEEIIERSRRNYGRALVSTPGERATPPDLRDDHDEALAEDADVDAKREPLFEFDPRSPFDA